MSRTAQALRTLVGRETDARSVLPYARHVDEEVLALDSGALMIAFALDGASFETADIQEINDRHGKLNGVWRNLADDHLAVWQHVVRTSATVPEADRFQSHFARDLDAAYRERIGRRRMFANQLYLTLVLHPGLGADERARAALARFSRPDVTTTQALKLAKLREAARDLLQHLGRYGPRTLGLYEHRGFQFSEPLEMLRLILGGRRERVPLVNGHLGQAIYCDRLIFGRESLEVRGPAETHYGAMLGIKEYPAVTRPGLWDDLLTAPFPFVISQSFAFLSKTAARGVMERKQNQMLSARDRAASQIGALGDALDDLTSNRFVMGDHQASVLVLGETQLQMTDAVSRARAILADSGLVTAREDLGLEGAFWAQFPGVFARRPRPAAITSRNFAGLAPLHAYPAGKASGNHWGPAVALLRTPAGSPFHFNFHVGDLGHTFICGPSGSGKTVLQNFLLAQLERFDATRVFVDKDRGADVFVRASGGTYLTLRDGEPTGFSPLKALPFTPANQAFFGALIRRLVTLPGEVLSAQAEHAIDAGVAALGPLPPEQRSLSALRTLLGQRDGGGVGARLERWTSRGALGWVFDNPADLIALDAPFTGFDMTTLLDHVEVRGPAMMYLLHRIQALADGRRLVVDIDEFWKALSDEAFRGLAQDGLKTWRKQNAILVLGTQSPADALRSPIAHTLVEMCATKIFLPNPAATARDYCEGFGLSTEELRLIREELRPEQHRFLVRQGHDSVIAELDLSGLKAELDVLSGRAETVALVDQLRLTHGDTPDAWLPHFIEHRRSS